MAKNRLGRFALGVTAVVAGVSLYLYFDENARNKVEAVVNREKAKAFVRQNLKGSPALLKAIDELSDAEMSTVMNLIDEASGAVSDVADKASDSVEQAGDTLNQIADRAVDMGKDLVNRVSDFVK